MKRQLCVDVRSPPVIIIHIGTASSDQNSDPVNKIRKFIKTTSRIVNVFNFYYFYNLFALVTGAGVWCLRESLKSANHSLFLPRNVC